MSATLVVRLIEASQRDAAASERVIDWPARLDGGAWCFSPEWLSLWGTPTYEALPEPARRRLALHEALGFFSLNLHGEGPLIAELSSRGRNTSGPFAEYERHFLAEEQRHSGWFREFCLRYGGKVYPERKLAFPRPTAPGEAELLFFAQALVFEELVDAYDAAMARDLRLAPVVRTIHALHHRDECRHRAFGRLAVRELWEQRAEQWPDEVVARVRGRLTQYLASVWLEYYNPEVYRDAGLPSPLEARREAWSCPAQRERRARLLVPIRRFFDECGLLPQGAAA